MDNYFTYSRQNSWDILLRPSNNFVLMWYGGSQQVKVATAWGSGFVSPKFRLSFPFTMREVPREVVFCNGAISGTILSAGSYGTTTTQTGEYCIFRATKYDSLAYFMITWHVEGFKA